MPAVIPGNATVNFGYRQLVLDLVGVLPIPPAGDVQAQLLGDLVGSFGRFAGNQQTAFDAGGSTAAGDSGANVLETKVLRAWTRVLGRSPGRSPDSFRQALAGAFPVSKDGAVATAPTRTAVAMYNPDGLGSLATLAGNYGGQLSVGQAALFRQASV